jgi:hypothetical protein
VNWNSKSMSCDDVRTAIADSLIVGQAEPDTVVDAHVATCDECREYRDECRRLWSDLGSLPIPSPRVGARRRLENALSPRAESRPWVRQVLIAAGFVLAMVIGYGFARWRESVPAHGAQQYLILLYDTDSTSRISPAAMSAVIAEYAGWARGLRSKGKLVTAEKLADAPSAWFGGQVASTGGERLGGFFLIRVGSAEEAREIAAQCPHVRRGGRVELRAIQKT